MRGKRNTLEIGVLIALFVLCLLASKVTIAMTFEKEAYNYYFTEYVSIETESDVEKIKNSFGKCKQEANSHTIVKDKLYHSNTKNHFDSQINSDQSLTANVSELPVEERLEVGVWFYANFFKDSIPLTTVDKFKNLGFNTIYFAGTTTTDWQDSAKSHAYLEFVCYAYSKGLDVYAVTLEDPFFAFEHEQKLQKEFSEFIEATNHLFKTYMIDVEPHTLHFSDPLVYVPQYIRMSLILENVSAQYNITFIDTVPYWYHFVIKNIGISPGVDILGGNKVNLMDYSYTFNQSITNINNILSEVKKPYTISIKNTPGYGDPFLSERELIKTIEYLQNRTISYGLFESQYVLRDSTNNHMN